MAEETIPVPLASPVIKPTRSDIKKPKSSGGKVVVHDHGGSTGSCHKYCEHWKSEEAKESRPWRKEIKVTAVIKKTVDVKPKPNVMKGKQKIVSTSDSEYVDVRTEQSASDYIMSVTGDSIISEGPESILPSEEATVKQVASEIDKLPAEEPLLNTKDVDLFKKSCSLSKVKPSLLRLPSLISSPSSAEARNSVDGKKVLEGKKSFNGRKVVGIRKSLEGPKISDESKSIDSEITQKADGNASIVEKNNEISKSADEMKTAQGSESSPVKKGLQKSKSLNLEATIKVASLMNHKINEKLETPKKLVAAQNRKIPSMRQSRSLNPATLKSSYFLHPSNGSSNQAVKEISTSKIVTKKATKPTLVSPSSSSQGDKSTDVKNAISTVRKPSKTNKVVTKDLVKQGLREVTPEMKLLANTKTKATSNNSLRSPALSLTMSTVRSRTSYLPSRVKNSVGQSEQKAAANDKTVNLESVDQRLSKLKAKSATTVSETTLRRSYLNKDNSTGGAHKKSSDKFLPGRPIVRRKKILVLSNKVIEETANRLIRTKKSKVLALIGAFESVISIQKISSARTKKKITSSKISF